MVAILRTVAALVVVLLSPIAVAGDSSARLVEEVLLGDWEGTNAKGTKITAKFEKEGAATFRFFFNDKVTPWQMKYAIDNSASRLTYAGKQPSGNTWEGELSPTGEDELSGDYTFFSSSRSFPSKLTLKRVGK